MVEWTYLESHLEEKAGNSDSVLIKAPLQYARCANFMSAYTRPEHQGDPKTYWESTHTVYC